MRYAGIAFSLIVVLLVTGCVQDVEPITELRIRGHGDQVYTFNNDIRASIMVRAEDEAAIRALFFAAGRMTFAFDGTDEQDNTYFNVVLVDLQKIRTYLAYEGNPVPFDAYNDIYFSIKNETGIQWYRGSRTNPVDGPPSGLLIELRGPATATDMSITRDGTKVVVQGQSFKNLSLAADKLTLIVFGIDSIDQIAGAGV